jgi:hypothetical protein
MFRPRTGENIMKVAKYIPKANTQYNDLFGSAAADFFNNRFALRDFAEEKGIDTKKYLPVSIVLNGLNKISASILVLDKEHPRKPLKSFQINTNKLELNKLFKRFQVVLSFNHIDPLIKRSFKEKKEFFY